MKSEQLHQVREACKEQILAALMTLVRENGVDYNDYFRNEHGIEEGDGYKIVKVFDIASFGCHMALPLKWCDGIEGDTDPTIDVLNDEFGYNAYWSLYIERDKTGSSTLMLYQFYNSGVCWSSSESEPDHHPASDLSLAELDYLTQAIYWHLATNKDNDPAATTPPDDPAQEVYAAYSEDMRKAVAYINEQLEPEDKAIIAATIDKNYKRHMNPAYGIDEDKITDMLEEYGTDHDLPEGWWMEEKELDDIVLLIRFEC